MMSRSSMNKNIAAIKKLAHLGKYQEAAGIADEVRWGRVKDVKTLNMVSDIYEKCERYHDAKRVMMVVYNRVDANKRLVYKMCELSAKAGDLTDAEEFYWEYSNLAPKDPGKLILAYYVMCASKDPDEKKIEVLELYIKEDFDEKWAYKLAQLYYKTGQFEKCVRTCDEIILWYSGDRYGAAALRLKHKCLGIEDEVVPQKAKIQAEKEAEADREKKVATVSSTPELVLDSEDTVDNKDTEVVISDKGETEPEIINKSENESGLWFDLKAFNKDTITKEELAEESVDEFNGIIGEEDFEDFEDLQSEETAENNDSDVEERDFEYSPDIDTLKRNCGDSDNDVLDNEHEEVFGVKIEAEEVEEGEFIYAKAVDINFADDADNEQMSLEEYFGDDVFNEDTACEDSSETESTSETELEQEDVVEYVTADDYELISDECEDVVIEELYEKPIEELYEELEEDAPSVVESPVRRNRGIILETCNEREQVFVFNQNEADAEAPLEELIEEIEEKSTEELVEKTEEKSTEEFATEEAEEFVEDELIAFSGDVFIEADIADSDDEENFNNDIFTEEIYIDEDIADEDTSDEDVVDESTVEQILEAVVSEEFTNQIPETVTVEEEAVVTEEPADAVDANAEAAVTEEPADAIAEAVVTEETEATVDQKVTFVGYIDGESNFKSAEDETEKESSKNITERLMEEKTESQRKSRYGNNEELRILLVECSQMKGGVKYTANKLHNLHQQEGTKLHGIARISDTKLSIRGAESAISVLRGRDLVVEGVDGITYEVVNELMDILDETMKPTILAIVDTPTKLALFINRHRTFAGRCEYIYEEASVSRREFLNYINNYAYKLEAVLDDMAEEELEYIADEMIEDGISFTISDAAALVERALEKAQKPGLKGLFEAKKDSDGYLILRARHFDRG